MAVDENNDEEITLKEIIFKLVEFKNLLLQKWKLILIISIVFGGIFLTKAWRSGVTYKANLTFAVDSGEKKAGLAAYSGLASQFGINIGAEGGGSVFGGENLIELFKSRKVVEDVLLSEVDTSGGKLLLIDYYLHITKLRKAWDENPLTKSLANLDYGINEKDFTLQHDSILYVIQSGIKEKLEIGLVNKEASILSVKYKSSDERFSKIIVEQIVKVVGDLYSLTKTEKSLRTINSLEHKVDSIKRELYSAELALAAHKDNSYRTIKAKGYLTEIRLEREVRILGVMYSEVLRNLEISRFSLMNKTPLVQIIDTPKYPLPYDKPSRRNALMAGLFIGGFLTSLAIILKKVFTDIMK